MKKNKTAKRLKGMDKKFAKKIKKSDAKVAKILGL
jgi:hypothetical protein